MVRKIYDHRTETYHEVEEDVDTEEEDTSETVEDPDGMYHCKECGHNHYYDSNIGEKHLNYKADQD